MIASCCGPNADPGVRREAVTTLEKDADVLLTFFDFPAEQWKQ
jgi:hypothetical protein